MTPEELEASERRQRARIAALHLHASRDSTAHLAPARRGFREKFERLADPEGMLPIHERERRGELLLRAHMQQLAMRSRRQGRSA